MPFNAGSKPDYALPKPKHVTAGRTLGKLSVPTPKGSVKRPSPSSTCCGKRA